MYLDLANNNHTQRQELSKALALIQNNNINSPREDELTEVLSRQYYPPGIYHQGYDVFWDIRMNTPFEQTISYEHIYYYKKVYEINLEHYEVGFIMSCDKHFMSQYQKQMRENYGN